MMKRYLVNFDMAQTPIAKYDVVVVGSGIAGMYTAINLSKNYSVCLITKDSIKDNNSHLAQGGISACLSGKEVDINCHLQDTMKAGSFHNDFDAVKMLTNKAAMHIKNLVDMGTNFDRDNEGQLLTTREGGHTSRRILHAKDQTGKEIMRAMGQHIRKKKNIVIMERTFAVDILTHKGDAIGALVEQNGNIKTILAPKTVMATGGIGQCYGYTTNVLGATGDGIAMALRAGAELIDMEFIQFHPTAFYSQVDREPFLISESLRGEGGILRNHIGKAFMEDYHDQKDLAPRDIVANAMVKEMNKSKTSHVYLDMTHLNPSFLKKRFPFIYDKCLSNGIDITQSYIPVCPMQHYIMGGIKTDYKGRTNITNLYACGETASTGVHGANRLASNSLLEGLVFGKRVAEDINDSHENLKVEKFSFAYTKEGQHSISNSQVLRQVKNLMYDFLFVIRTHEGIQHAKRRLSEIMETLEQSPSIMSRQYFECMNIAMTASEIIEAASQRKNSLGSHIIVKKEGEKSA